MTKRLLVVVAVAVVLAATVSLFASVAATAAKGKVSTVAVLDQHAGVAKKRAPTKFVAVKKTALVATGDTVATDARGFAEVRYPDGSLTRVDVATTFVVDLATKTATKTTLSTGQMWNEVKKATGSQPAFEVATPNATAAVRGTAFGVRCDRQKACSFGVIDGTVEVTSGGASVALTAGQQVAVDASGQVGQPETLVVGQWIKQNQYQDIAVGRTAPGVTGAPVGLTASPPTPQNIAKAISAERAQKIAAGNFIGASYTSVTCEGNGVLRKGAVTHCTASGPSGTSIVYRVVVLNAAGTFGLTRHQTIVDTHAAAAQLISVPEGDGGLLTSADCGPEQYMVVDVPSGVFTRCALVDDAGRTGNEPLYLDADGTLQSLGATLSGGDVSADAPADTPAEDQPAEAPVEEPAPEEPSGGAPVDNGGDAISYA
jgi:hypothetical protein